MDGKFDKSYGRIILCFINLHDLDKAHKLRELVKKMFKIDEIIFQPKNFK